MRFWNSKLFNLKRKFKKSRNLRGDTNNKTIERIGKRNKGFSNISLSQLLFNTGCDEALQIQIDKELFLNYFKEEGKSIQDLTADARTALLDSLTTFEEFQQFLCSYECLVCSLSENLTSNKESIRSDGFCWYVIWANIWLIHQGKSPRKFLLYEEDDKKEFLLNLTNMTGYYTDYQLLKESAKGDDVSLQTRLFHLSEFLSNYKKKNKISLGKKYWGGDFQDFGTVPIGCYLVYWEPHETTNRCVLTKISTNNNMNDVGYFNLTQLEEALNGTNTLHCVCADSHYYFVGHKEEENDIIYYGNILGQFLQKCVKDLYGKLKTQALTI
jgi:hypothetical protein